MTVGRDGARSAGVVGLLALVWATAPAGAVVVGQSDTFEDGTAMGWRHGSPSSPLPPSNIASGGPAGKDDNYLLVQTDGGETGSASNLLAMNTAQWLGDYLSAGIGAVRLDARNYSDAEMVLRLGFRGSNASMFVTEGITLPAGSGWTNLAFNLSPSNMALASGAYADCFGGVTMVRILHNPSAPSGDNGQPVRDATGAPIAAQLGLDNLTAVPEPGIATSLLGAAAALLVRGRRR